MRTATLLLIVSPLFAQDAQPIPEGASLDIVVMEAIGEVDVRSGPDGAWGPAAAGQHLPVGSKICTGVSSSATIAFGTNSVALVTEATVFEVRRFALEGDKLIANVFIDPGVTRVSVKQLAQFHTDFQVSTPRLTCSVRGTVTQVSAPGDEEPHRVDMLEGTGHVRLENDQERTVTVGGAANSNNESPIEIALRANLTDTTPEGVTEQETQDENLLANTNQSLELDTGSLTTNTDPSPSGSDGNLELPPHDGGTAPPETGGFLMDLVLMALNGQDVTVHAADDTPGEGDGEEGVEGIERQDLLDLFQTQGIDAFLNALLTAIHEDFHDPTMDQLEQTNPSLFAERHDLFHDALPEAGFNALTTYLQAAAVQAVNDPVDARDATLILASLFHTDWHIIHANDPVEIFDTMHTEFHNDEMDPILQAILETRYEDALAGWAYVVHRTWHENTGCDDFVEAGEICFTPHAHFEMRLLETGTNLRDLTATLGIQTVEEELMVHTYLNHADIRNHAANSDDVTTFDIRHSRMDFDHNGLSISGLASGVKEFDVADMHLQFHEDPAGLEQTDPSLFAQRHTDFHVSDSVFGLDGYNAFWFQVAEQARSQNLDTIALGHALIAGIDVDFLRNAYAMPPGTSPGEYDFERAQFLQNVIDPLHATSDAGQFAQFVHDYDNFVHDRWHANTGVPTNVQQGQTGFEAHEHFHQSLDEFHTQIHTATGVPDP